MLVWGFRWIPFMKWHLVLLTSNRVTAGWCPAAAFTSISPAGAPVWGEGSRFQHTQWLHWALPCHTHLLTTVVQETTRPSHPHSEDDNTETENWGTRQRWHSVRANHETTDIHHFFIYKKWQFHRFLWWESRDSNLSRLDSKARVLPQVLCLLPVRALSWAMCVITWWDHDITGN